MLHASGKFVSLILDYLAISFLPDDENMQLMKFHELVMQHFKADSDALKAELTLKLDELIPKIKDMAANFKKPMGKNKDENKDEE